MAWSGWVRSKRSKRRERRERPRNDRHDLSVSQKKDPAHGLETVDEASIAPRQGGYAAADNPIIDEP